MSTIFILPDSDQEISDTMRKACNVLEENNVTPKWIDQTKCLEITEKVKMTFFVCDPFSGPAFEHLKNLQCRVVGPLCILHCLERSESLPNLPYPVFNSPMKGVLACCTNITVENRKKLFNKIQLMGGRTSGTFTEQITHLIADEVGSKKYHVAARFKTPVMMSDWVYECWEVSQRKNILSTDAMFDKFRCPILKGLIITVTQLEAEERKQIQNLIEQNGGVYSGDLCLNKTTHLIGLNTQGQKYKFAQQWKVICVTVTWLHDSIKSGYALDETLYKLIEKREPIITTSSPQKKLSNARELRMLSTSAITAVSPVSNVNETVVSLEGSFLKPTNPNKMSSSLDNLEMNVVYKAGNFLDGCKIFLSGFDNVEVEKLRRVINSGGGTRLNQMSESVSHCVLKDKCEDLIAFIREKHLKPHIVSIDWIVDSCHAGYVIDETVYSLWDQMSILTSPNKEKSKVVNESNEVEKLPDEDEVLSQYLGIESQTMLEDDEMLLKAVDDVEATINKSSSRINIDFEMEDEEDIDEDKDQNGVFKNLVFSVIDFNDDNYELVVELIKENGGKVVSSNNTKREPDYVVVPLPRSASDFLSGKIVTAVWLQICVEESKIIPLNEEAVFTPIYCNLDSKPLQGCILTLSQFTGITRKSLIELAETLGAKYQEFFVRRTVYEKCLFASTHLLCVEAEGNKYLGAVKWKLPAVNKQWLVDCAQNDRWMPEKKYLIGNMQNFSSSVNDESRKQNLNSNESSSSNILESTSNSVPQTSSPVKTPVTVKKRILSIEKSIESMRQMFTPPLKINRIKEIQEDELNLSRPNTPDSDSNCTPSKFLGPNQKYVPKFTFPSSPEIINKKKKPSRESIEEVHELFFNRIKTAVDNSKSFGPFGKTNISDLEGPLKDVVVCVSRRLNHHQAELKKMVASLGGECRWIFDDTCTHFVYQGKPSGNCEDYKMAKQLKKKIVAPDWIKACHDQKKLVNESRYPPTFNPNMTLDITFEKTPYSSLSQSKKMEISDKGENPYLLELNDSFDNDDEEDLSMLADHNTSTGSDEVRDTINRQIAQVLAVKSESKSKSKRRKTSSSNLSEDESVTSVELPEPEKEEVPVAPGTEKPVVEVEAEPSQALGVTWGDTSEKSELDRIAAQLAKESQAISLKKKLEMEKEDGDITDVSGSDKENENGGESPVKQFENKSRVKNHRIMLSGFMNSDRADFAKLIEELGGTLSDSQTFDKDGTHLIANAPSRNEKFLASIASGKWILHKSYLEECKKENRFVDEENHEWGGEGTKLLIENMQPQVAELATIAKKWRLKVQNNDVPKVFSGWNCIIYTQPLRESSFRRLLDAGDAVISNSVYPFSDPQGATHAFIELSCVTDKEVDFTALVAANVACIRFEFIAAFLTDENTADMRKFVIPEAVEALKTKGVKRESKRKPNGDTSSSSKKRKNR